MADNWKGKIAYLDKFIRPALEAAFKRGDKNYKNMEDLPKIKNRQHTEDIRHIRECHVDVRLREAEDFADLDNMDEALKKIESSIGYLVILHRRIRNKQV